jgi:hypothetical protein
VGVLNAFSVGVTGRPAVAAKLLANDALNVFMSVLQQVTPIELVTTAGYVRRCEKRLFLSNLYISMTILPRQARDKHRKNSK